MSEKSNLNEYFTSKSESDFDTLFPQIQRRSSVASFFDQISAGSSSNQVLFNVENSTEVSDTADHRRRDAWIPKEETQRILVALATTKSGSMFVDRDHLTMPGTMIENQFEDQVASILNRLEKSETAQRCIMRADDVTQDERGLQQLIEKNCFRSAINLTECLLKIYGQGVGTVDYPTKHSPRSLQIWFCRLSLLVKTKMFSFARKEAKAFKDLDQPDLYYAYYPDLYEGRIGSMVPFSFRLLIAEIEMHERIFDKSLKTLFRILSITIKIIKNLQNGLYEDGNPSQMTSEDREQSLNLWQVRKRRVLHSLINCCFLKKDYTLTLDLINTCLKDCITPDEKKPYYGVMGRIYLEIRDLQNAKLYLAKNQTHDNHVAICERNFKEAEAFLKQAHQMEPKNLLAASNLAFCLLHNCRVTEAIILLESAVEANLLRALQNEEVLITLCRLYDLKSTSGGSRSKIKLFKTLAKLNCDIPQTILDKFHNLF